MNRIGLGNINKLTPSTWNELTPRQLIYVASQWQGWKHIELSKQKGIATAKQRAIDFSRIALLQQLLDINPFNIFSPTRRAFNNVAPEQMVDLLKTTDFIFAENTLTENKFHKSGKLYGPRSELKYMRIGEFAYTETAFLRYHNTGKAEHLNNLCAILYRPIAKGAQFGDVREAFNPQSIENRIPTISGWSEAQKQAVLLFYIGCRTKITRTYQKVFEGKAKGKESANWATIIIELAGNKFGTVNEVEDQYLSTILIHLKQLAITAQKQK